MSTVYDSWLGRATLTAELCLPATTVKILSFDLVNSDNRLLREENSYRLDLSLTPRLGSTVRFADRWGAHRYERVGRLFLLPPQESLKIRSGTGRQDAIICYLPRERLNNWLEYEPVWTDKRLEASLDIPSALLGDLLIQLGDEARHPSFGGELVSEALAVQIAVTLERYYRNIAEPTPAGGLSTRQLRVIDERLQDLATIPTLSELAILCGLSVRQLSRAFHVNRGLSLGAYVAQVRMQAAKRLLSSAESVKAVAYEMGFGSPASFAYAFRQATGLSPSAYRTGLSDPEPGESSRQRVEGRGQDSI